MKTLLLDVDAWDLVLDVYGNIAVAAEPYSMAQDAASACRLFRGELWYNTLRGVPYFTQILGKSPPPLSLMKAEYVAAARTVPGVTAARCFLSALSNRRVTGQIQVTDQAGNVSASAF